MSVLNQSGEEQVECPLCMEPLEVDDLHFYPCTCGYQICRFCWNRIREGENGLCPACRKAYPENPADFTPLSQEQVAAIKTEKKAREQKRRNKTLESRRALANVRVVQNNLVFVVGLPVRLADPEILKRQEYFGKYGKIHKVVINQSTSYAGTQGPSASAYVTYVTSADALRAIQGVNNVTLDGRVLKSSLGTTKYCANFMKNQPCPKADCMYLHELGDPKASFTKEEMHAGLHQVYERRLHQQLRDRPDDKHVADGSSSTNAEKGSSKDGNQSNFIPTTVVTSSQVNIVSTSKSKKDSGNGSNSNGNGASSNGVSNSNGKEAWPSLGSSPPSDSPARKQSSPKPQQTVKSQENGTSESSSPTQLQTQSQTKNSKENHVDSKPSKSNTNNTNGQTGKKSKSDSKSKQKNSNNNNNSNSNSNTSEVSESQTFESKTEPQSTITPTQNSVFENDTQSYLTNDLDELESDRHSLLENHDLLNNSDHSLLEDDNTHNLLNDANNEILMMQRHREMLAGLVDNHLMPQMKSPIVNGYGLLDRDSMYLANDRQISQINHSLMDQKEMLLRERSRNNMILRQNEMLARQHNVMVEPKHYNMPTSSIGLDSASELLGTNYHPNHNMLPPFGMRVDNSMGTSSLGNTMANTMSANSMSNITSNPLSANTMANSMGSNSLSANSMVNSMGSPMGNTMGNTMVNSMGSSMANSMGSTMANSMGSTMANSMGSSIANSMGNSMGSSMGNSMGSSMGNSMGNAMGYLMHNQQMAMQNQSQMLLNGFDTPQSASEGRYQAENMDKFFTDFHKAQQIRLLLSRGEERRLEHAPLAHSMLSAERLEMEHKQRMNNLRAAEAGGRAAGDGDDDLDFDPFKETQKALAEMMETEVMLNSISSGDNMERVRRARLPPPGFAHMNTFGLGAPAHQGHQQDWTQMDPAIMSTSVNFGKSQPLRQDQQELFARFNHMQVQPNGVKMPPQWPQQKMSWPHQHSAAYNTIPLPPGFAPAKNPAECIDAK
ncbi:putative uncharacterized protein DDB_G0286901 isoform X2 [Bicyclus anynana]|uniref:CCR4-NOT transcription complex subunit 4 n=1 Tax=Bicyclus anynana TaxID=110368 RepID=A0ABM3M1L9_BICAN|nr:putative uncharacterized protein DDB_G0286901 isoform X2 [Bicyclus anynana]